MPLDKTYEQLTEEAKQEITTVSCEELRASGREQILIDVREPEEWQGGIIPGAYLIPRGTLERDIAQIVFDGTIDEAALEGRIICYCAAGHRSALAARALKKMCFKDPCSMDGGIRRWKEEGRATE